MLGEVDVDELPQARCLDEALLASEPVERPRERLGRGLLRLEAAALYAPRTAPADPVSICPCSPAASAPSLQLQHLTLLRHC
jgi:hypothetical protein